MNQKKPTLASEVLWLPDKLETTHMYRFMQKVNDEYKQNFTEYSDLHAWSVAEPDQFWSVLAQYCDIQLSQQPSSILQESGKFHAAKWFSGAKMNFAENLLRNRDDRVALVAHLENQSRRVITYAGLYQQVSKLTQALSKMGVEKGDRVAAIVPNISEAVVAMLATTSLGAIWSSCSADFGVEAAYDRFSQIKPKILIGVDGYYYSGKRIECLEKTQQLSEKLAVQHTILVNVIGENQSIENLQYWQQIIDHNSPTELIFEQCDFDHPVYILYSSGTTGKPKCIVHGAGGTLLQHRKEHVLHTNLTEDDVLFYFTTCGWMMWNWLISGLATGATVVLYDGNPFVQNDALLDLIDNEKISIFGTSAKYLDMLQKLGSIPQKTHSLNSLKTILSTGSPLVPERFDYVYDAIKSDVLLASISGGTDIVSCFLLGNPMLPVYRGQLQCAGLGMEVDVYDEMGNSLDQSKGELVCKQPFPCAPIGFWNDDKHEKYRQAYFEKYPNVWAHGDYVQTTAEGGYIIHGRSDTVLNPGGVRIGTAEIYRQVEKVAVVKESVVVGQQWQDDVRVVLFVVLLDEQSLTEEIQTELRQVIRSNATPRHVPAKILQVTDIPRTRSGKITEELVRKLVNNEQVPVASIGYLLNPEVTNEYINREELRE